MLNSKPVGQIQPTTLFYAFSHFWANYSVLLYKYSWQIYREKSHWFWFCAGQQRRLLNFSLLPLTFISSLHLFQPPRLVIVLNNSLKSSSLPWTSGQRSINNSCGWSLISVRLGPYLRCLNGVWWKFPETKSSWRC